LALAFSISESRRGFDTQIERIGHFDRRAVTLYTWRMAKVDLARRAKIGQEKRARTRAALVAAARSLFSSRSIESVTIDEIVAEAGLAKGTFYTHFEDLDALTAAIADELVASFDDLMQPTRLVIADPLDRVAFGCNAFIEKAVEDPAWAQVVARMARFHPTVGEGTRSRLLEDLRGAVKDIGGPAPPLELALEIVVGFMLQALSAFAEKRVSRDNREPALVALLRALGADGRRIRTTMARLPKPPVWEAAQRAPRRRGALQTGRSAA
jgi:AcrR family transcriptional regulator